MPRYSPHYYSPPRRGFGGRGRSPPRGYSPPRRGYSPPRRVQGRRKDQNHGSLLVRNIPMDCRPEELRVPFERFGLVRDVYIPKDYYTGEPRGFAFVQFVDPYESAEAQYQMNGQIFAGREISVVAAAESRKRPEDMRRRSRVSNTRGRNPRYGGRRSPPYYILLSRSRLVSRSRSPGRSPSRSVSRSRSPGYRGGSKGGYRSRSISPSPRRPADYSVSPRRPAAGGRSRYPRESPRERDVRRSYTPNHDDGHNGKEAADGYDRGYDVDGRARLSSPGLRSRSVDLSPGRSG